jgi:hypothetical protein
MTLYKNKELGLDEIYYDNCCLQFHDGNLNVLLLDSSKSTEITIDPNLHPRAHKTLWFDEGITRIDTDGAHIYFDEVVIPSTVEYIDEEIIKNAKNVKVDENNLYLSPNGAPKLEIGTAFLDSDERVFNDTNSNEEPSHINSAPTLNEEIL